MNCIQAILSEGTPQEEVIALIGPFVSEAVAELAIKDLEKRNYVYVSYRTLPLYDWEGFCKLGQKLDTQAAEEAEAEEMQHWMEQKENEEEMQSRIEQAEREAGWDPNP